MAVYFSISKVQKPPLVPCFWGNSVELAALTCLGSVHYDICVHGKKKKTLLTSDFIVRNFVKEEYLYAKQPWKTQRFYT